MPRNMRGRGAAAWRRSNIAFRAGDADRHQSQSSRCAATSSAKRSGRWLSGRVGQLHRTNEGAGNAKNTVHEGVGDAGGCGSGMRGGALGVLANRLRDARCGKTAGNSWTLCSCGEALRLNYPTFAL